MDEEYDVIVLRTGLKECIPSGLLSVDGLKLWKRFRKNDQLAEHLGSSKECNVDMIPKFMMANGGLVRVLIRTDVTKYLNFKVVDRSFIYNKGKIYKVPAIDVEALKSPLMGLLEKRRARKFFIYVQDYEDNDLKPHEGLDLNKVTARDLITCSCRKYGLEDDTIDFTGHALALHNDDTYLDQPAMKFIKKMKVLWLVMVLFQYNNVGDFCKALCKVISKIPRRISYVSTVRGWESCLRWNLIAMGRHWSDLRGRDLPNARKLFVIHHICLIRYLFCCSYAHNVAPKGKYIAFVSTEAETDNPEVELKPGIDLLRPIDEKFNDTYNRFEPINDHQVDSCYISSSYDATTHFESTVQDVLAIYHKITGKALDLSVDLGAASAAAEE